MTSPATPRNADRQDRLIRERIHDPYKFRAKMSEPTVCSDCGAVYHKGRWQWIAAPAGARGMTAPAGARSDRCQACHRIRDNYPAGEVFLGGDFLAGHRDEILNLARNLEAQEKGEHPLNRIMDITDEGGQILIRTTDIHLPRRIGDAVFHAYEGNLDFSYDEEGYFIRVTWRRDG